MQARVYVPDLEKMKTSKAPAAQKAVPAGNNDWRQTCVA